MNAVIYARYSSDNQREESIEGQIRECTAYAERNGITVVRHYIDRALSAKTDNRPDFQQMIRDSNKKLFATVYKGNIIKNLIMDCQSYTKYRPNETTGGIFVSWRRKEELPTGA